MNINNNHWIENYAVQVAVPVLSKYKYKYKYKYNNSKQ